MMRTLDMIKRYFSSPVIRFGYLNRVGLYNSLSDEKFIKKKYKLVTGENLNLNNPQTFNEKIQWLKLHDRNPSYVAMVDKYAVKQYISEKIGAEYVIPTLGKWNHFCEIDFKSLPKQFVLKTTHDSGGVVIVRDKSMLDIKQARRVINNSLKRNYYYDGREWPYKDIKPCIIAEKYMVDESGVELKDYKIFCFDGKPKLMEVDFGRYSVHKRNLYTTDWKYIDASIKYPNDPSVQIPKPKRLEKMLEIASILSEGIPHVRVDLYSAEDKIYFGELTFHHGDGMEKFHPNELGELMGKWITIP